MAGQRGDGCLGMRAQVPQQPVALPREHRGQQLPALEGQDPLGLDFLAPRRALPCGAERGEVVARSPPTMTLTSSLIVPLLGRHGR
jgi:hypothetical protein